MKRIFLLFTVSGLLLLIFLVGQKSTNKEFHNSEKTDAIGRVLQEFLMLRDPITNKIPDNIMALEQQFAKTLPQRENFFLMKGRLLENVQALTWTERGPNNTSGRIRGFDIDVRTTTAPNITISAGGVSGGMWKTTDDGATWLKKTTSTQLHSVTCVVQDKRTGKEDIWYAGSGERTGNSAAGGEATFLGDGLFKSVDNGNTWSPLPTTQSSSPQTFASNWQYVWNTAIDLSEAVNDEVYAATYGAIQRSINGGTSWTEALSLANGAANSTDVLVTLTGVVYASASKGGAGNSGIFRSIDGITWTNITPAAFPTNYGRIVLASAPSDQNIIYCLVQGTNGINGTNQINNHQLWKYTYTPGVGNGNGDETNGGSWSNRGVNLPTNTVAGPSNFDTQGGYDMLLSVKPDNPNFVIFGGVNLYKTTDGLATTTNVVHIGGYGQTANGTANAVGDYINNHPDHHNSKFLPGSNSIFYNVNDGGVHKANDISAAADGNFWVAPKRTGLNITQPYSVSISPDAGSNFIASGLQDRGNWMVRIANPGSTPAAWQECSGGDGAQVCIAPDADDRIYASTTEGAIFRYNKSVITEPVTNDPSTTTIKPTGVANVLFVNPFQLDPVNSNYLYFAGGNTATNTGIWRNSDIKNSTETNGWTFLTSTTIEGDQVSSIGISRSNNANVVYFGTSGGKVYRIDNATTGASPTVTDIYTGKGLPTGYVSSIAVDPNNSAKAVLVFSNYSVKSIWYTTDSGNNWADVSGNLEQNPDGTGNGPSIRAVSVFYISGTLHVFASTSTGLYYTINLNGTSTVWTQEGASVIGNVVCVASDYRPADNTFVVATHGRGVFQTVISSPLPVELAAFSGVFKNNSVELYWKTITERDNYGFAIEVKINDEDYHKIGFVEGSGTSNKPKEYTFKIENVSGGNRYLYRLTQINLDGEFSYSNSISIDPSSMPKEFTLKQNYPNPFNPSTIIEYSLPENSFIELKVYSVTGEEIAVLVSENRSAGEYKTEFNASGLPSGIYLFRLSTGKDQRIIKSVLLK